MGRRRVARLPGVVAVVAAVAVGVAAQAAVSRAATIQITGTVVSLALVNPVPESWEFTLEGQLRPAEQDFLFRDPRYTPGKYYLLVRSNTPLTLSLEGSGVRVASNGYPATFEWSLSDAGDGAVERQVCVLPADSPCAFYRSVRAVRNDRINLSDFYIVHPEPVASGALRGEVVVTVSL